MNNYYCARDRELMREPPWWNKRNEEEEHDEEEGDYYTKGDDRFDWDDE